MPEPLGRVAVFWHYDSLPPPSIGGSPRAVSRATYDAIFNIRQVLYRFGIITSFRAYVGPMPLQAKLELQSHGVTAIECLWNASETMITADMFQFALDNPSLGTTLVLISSSSTLAYTTSLLGARRYRIALISIPDPRNNVLLAQASEVIDWRCLRSRGNVNDPWPIPFLPGTQTSSNKSFPEYPTGVEQTPHTGLVNSPHNTGETSELSFTISDLNLAGNGGEGPGSPPRSQRCTVGAPTLPPVDGRPPSRQIEEAILKSPVAEDAEEYPGPRSFDSKGRSICLLNRPYTRSASEPALRGNTTTVRPRSNSLQDGGRSQSPSRKLTLGDYIAMRTLPTPRVTPLSFEGPASERFLNVGASPFVSSLGMTTPPSEPSEDAATTVFPSAPGPGSTIEPAEEIRSPSLRLERRDSVSSISFAPSTTKPVVASAVVTPKSGPPTKLIFTKGERRAVETVINVLLEMKSKGETRVSSRKLPNLILTKDKMVYKGAGHRGNRFWKLIDLGVEMGWLEVGPENAWIDIGKAWTEEAS